MDLDREGPGVTGEVGLYDEPPRDLNKYQPEVTLPRESRLIRAIRIAVVAILGFWIVAGAVALFVR
jgi:hypothetical protein